MPPRARRAEGLASMDIRAKSTPGPELPPPILSRLAALADGKRGRSVGCGINDSGLLRDFQAFAKQTGNELVEQHHGR